MKNGQQHTVPARCNDHTNTPGNMVCYNDTAALRDLFNKIRIESVQSDITQIPDTSNNHTAAVKSTVQTDTGRFDGIGCASPDDVNGSANVQRIVDAATIASLKRAAALALYATDSTPTVTVPSAPVFTNQPVQSSRPARPGYPARANNAPRQHKTEPGSISPKQMDLIKRLAAEGGTTVESLARTVCRCDPKSLSSSNANEIIQYVKRSQ